MSNISTIVLFKDPREDNVHQLDWKRYAVNSEVLTSLSIDTPYPVTNPSLQATTTDDYITLSGGMDRMSYGANLTLVFDSGRIVLLLLAVSVVIPTLMPMEQHDPGSFSDLIDTIQAGHAALGVGVFVFDPTVDPSGGFVEWRLLDNEGTVLNAGNAFDYRVTSNGISNIVQARCLVNVPSNVSPSNYNEKYQVQYILYLEGVYNQAVSENVKVIGLTNTPLGTSDIVELHGSMAPLTLVTDTLYETVQVEIHSDNKVVGGANRVTDFERVDSGYAWGAYVDTKVLVTSLIPYVVVWSYWNLNKPSYHEYGKLFIVNSSILDAINDVQARVNKARTTLYGMPDMLFTPETILIWLRRGGDYFNGTAGHFTNFTFTNAKSIVREMWLQCAEMMALESQELAEAEKAFDYQGANISLNVDRSQGYAAAADKIRSRLDQELRPIKTNLIIKGNTSGDGSADPTYSHRGALGAVAITITPATMWGRFPFTGYPRLR